jgi:hypothetical protein
MKRMFLSVVALAFIASAWSDGTVVLGNGKGKVRSTNALAAIGAAENPLEWSRRDFNDAGTAETYGYWPAYSLSNETDDPVFGLLIGPNVTVNMPVAASLQGIGWPASIHVPRYLYRQAGGVTNRRLSGDHSTIAPIWIKYELDNTSPDGWDIQQVKIFAWELRDVIQRGFSDTGAPYQIDVYVASSDTNSSASPLGNAEWTQIGSVSKGNATILDVCRWDATNPTFGITPASSFAFLAGANDLSLAFWDDPTNDLWYSIVQGECRPGVRYIALVIPRGNQYGQDAQLNATTNTGSSLQYSNFTDVRVIACKARTPGDVNGDGCVDDRDLLAVLFAFGGSGGPEDLNGDGIVDDADLLEVLFNFGNGC